MSRALIPYLFGKGLDSLSAGSRYIFGQFAKFSDHSLDELGVPPRGPKVQIGRRDN